MSARSCDWFEERLALLHYRDLPEAEAQAVREHLADCAECSDAQAEVLRAATLLDQAPIERPAALAGLRERVLKAVGDAPECPRELDLQDDPAAMQDHLAECASCAAAAKELVAVGRALDLVGVPALGADRAQALTLRVLTAVGQACPWEAELLWKDELAAEEAAGLERHVAECAVCQRADAVHAGVGRALDLVPVPEVSPERWVRLREDLSAATGARTPRGRVISFPGRIARIAAAFLVGATLAFSGYLLSPHQRQAERLARLEREADALLRQADADLIPGAVERYTELTHAGDPGLASRARHEVDALRSLQAREQKGTAAPAITAPRAAAPRDVLIGYKDVLIEFPGTRASLYAIKKALPARYRPDHQGPIRYDLRDVETQNPAHALRLRELMKDRPRVLRFDYEGMQQLVRSEALIDVGLRQSVLVQQGLHAEELSVIAMSTSSEQAERYRAEARRALQEVIALDGSTKAAGVARQALVRLG